MIKSVQKLRKQEVNGKIKKVVLLTAIILAGFWFFPGKALAYNTEGILISKNLLSAAGASIIHSFTYNVTAIPAGTGLKIQFSKDNINWYDSAGTVNALNTLSSGTHTIDLSALKWQTGYFYYKILFTSDGTDTPVLKSITLNLIDTFSTTNTYYTTGSLTSTNLLSGQTVSSITSFGYTATDIPSGTGLTCQFSQNNTNWYSSAGVLNNSDTLSAGANTISLSGLGWTSANFYYKMSFASDGTDTPVLDSIIVAFLSNTAPTLTNVSDSPDPIKGGSQITITPTGQGDAESDALYYYCNETGTATSANTLCSQANASYASPYSSMTCTYNVSTVYVVVLSVE
ncbi:hypothetical protein KKH26_02820 [Patescibacteria group bacterium]|nr:hypothetical protein [Patescibacteria group bacterium]